MKMTNLWNSISELAVAEAKKPCLFDVTRDKLVSEDGRYVSKHELLSIKSLNTNESMILGEVPAKRPFIHYSDAIDWINDQLAKSDTENKLWRSNVEGKSHALSQIYLFNREIQAPDKKNIFPMLFLRASYYGARPALELHFGAFRLICTNGALSSHREEKESYFRITAQNWSGLRNFEIHSWLEKSFARIGMISNMYKKLGTIPLFDKKKEIFSENSLSVSLRKNVLADLENDGKVEITVKNTRKKQPQLKSTLLKEVHLQEEELEKTVHFLGDTSLWDVYNNFTTIATTNSLTSARFIADSQRINEIFTTAATAMNKHS
jgi:hypothetical protein